MDPVKTRRAEMADEHENLPKAIAKLESMLDERARAEIRHYDVTREAEAKLAKLDNRGFEINLGQFGKDMLKAGVLGSLLGSQLGILTTATDRVMNADAKSDAGHEPERGKAELESELRKEKAAHEKQGTLVKQTRVFLQKLRERKWAMDRIVPGRGVPFRLAHRFGYAGPFLIFLASSLAAIVLGLCKQPFVALGVLLVAGVFAAYLHAACVKLVPVLGEYASVYPHPVHAWRRRGRFAWLAGAILIWQAALWFAMLYNLSELNEFARRRHKKVAASCNSEHSQKIARTGVSPAAVPES